MIKNYQLFQVSLFALVFSGLFFPVNLKAQISSVGCNYTQPWITDDFPNLQASTFNGVGSTFPLCLGSVTNVANLIDNNLGNTANINFLLGLGVGAGCDATLSVKDNSNVYPGGIYAGYRIGTSGLIGAGVGVRIEVSTYLNNSLQESQIVVSNLVGLNSDLLFADGTTNVGFITDSTKSFDEIRIECTTLVAALYTLNVYHAVVKKYCPGASTACNTRLSLREHFSPVELKTVNTGLLSVGGYTNPQHIIDSSLNNLGAINFPVSLLATASVQVRNVLDTYPAGHFAGFEISTGALADVNLLGNLTVATYNNGVFRESFAGNNLLLGVDVLNGVDSLRDVGFITTLDFDEIRLNIAQPVSVDLGTIFVRGAFVEPYCEGPAPVCGNTYALTRPSRTVIINEGRTGINGICVGCAVENSARVIDNDTSTFSRLSTLVAALGGTELSVQDIQRDYPAGTITGFTIRNINSLLEVDLLNSLRLTTYLDGVQQETNIGAGSLLTVALNLNLTTASDALNVAFRTTKPFDEVKISLNALASVLNEIYVYGAFVDTRMSNGFGLYCYEHHPDFKVGLINDTLTGNLATNDRISSPVIYSDPVALPDNPTAQLPTINPDGTYQFVTDTPGVYNFSYSICIDSARVFCETQMLSITIIDQKDTLSPVANNDIALVRKDQPVTVNVLANDKPANRNGSLGAPTIGTPPANGTAVVLPNGQIQYTPAPGFVGKDTFKYVVYDTVYNTFDTAYVFMDVLDTDHPNSVLAVDDFFQTYSTDSLVGNLLANDIDPDGDSIFAIPQTITLPEGTLVINADGSFVFHPIPGFSGELNIPYTVFDTDTTSPNSTGTLHILVLKSPDLVVTIFSTPNVVHSSTNIDMMLTIAEVNGVQTEGLITVVFPKDNRMTFTWNQTMTTMPPFAVNNSDWAYNGTSPFFHIFTTTITLGPNGVSRIGLPSTFNPGNTNGVFTITSTIVSNSGSEIKITNNSDSQSLNYFNQ